MDTVLYMIFCLLFPVKFVVDMSEHKVKKCRKVGRKLLFWKVQHL